MYKFNYKQHEDKSNNFVDFDSALNKLNQEMMKLTLKKTKIQTNDSAITITEIINELNNCSINDSILELSKEKQVNKPSLVYQFRKDLFQKKKEPFVDKLSNSCIYNNVKLKTIREAFNKTHNFKEAATTTHKTINPFKDKNSNNMFFGNTIQFKNPFKNGSISTMNEDKQTPKFKFTLGKIK